MKPESPRQEQPAGAPYEAPAIIYEGQITTRAGTEIPTGDSKGIDPAELFGSVK